MRTELAAQGRPLLSYVARLGKGSVFVLLSILTFLINIDVYVPRSAHARVLQWMYNFYYMSVISTFGYFYDSFCFFWLLRM